VFFGGKGGVGKTTCAAARAVAESAAGRRVLVVSTDPAHSLGDALGVRLSSSPRGITPRLRAVELDAPRAFARWLAEHRGPLGDILEHGTWLDRDDVEGLLDLSIPGIDELVGLLEITRLSQSGSADLIVVDTAPTGHTVRMLAAPEAVGAVARVFDSLLEQHRIIRQQLARVGRPEAADRLIAALAEQAVHTSRRLRDARQTTFHWVTLAEDLSLAETEDAVAAFERFGIDIEEIVVNRVLPAGAPCPMCDRRRARERELIARIRRSVAKGRGMRIVAAAIHEPRGLKALAAIGRALHGRRSPADGPVTERGAPLLRARDAGQRRRERDAITLSLPRRTHTMAVERIAAFNEARLLFVGGKGGVGKTTVAAAAAVRLARARPDQRILLLSTDPAHSLSDVLQTPIGDTPRALVRGPRNLVAREVDAPRALAARRADLEAALDEIASAFGADAAGTARSAELMELAPPGVDELFGMLSVIEARDRYHVIVVDTAPTGHALRLLEMPETARDWVHVLMRVLLKYRSLVRPGQLAAELVRLSQSIRDLQALLRDKTQTRFIVVSRAADVPRAETERLLARLRRLKLATPAVVVNAMTLAPGRCARCRATAAAERAQLGALRRACGHRSRECGIIQTPLSAPPPRGVRALEAWGSRWIIDRALIPLP
jgi:arsenite-transporting ATPase